jgi:hypothetical protein
VVADVIDHGERLVVLLLPEAAAELLEPEDSVDRSMRTVSSSGRSRPSLKTSTSQMTSSLLSESSSSDWARGALVGPDWTATARRPCCLRKLTLRGHEDAT